ncbi:MAG TPA: protein kinase, partial [Gemmataceae bacterium]|nr:protein kinase [Gemmataceae bacterium]
MSGAGCVSPEDLQAYLLGELPDRIAQSISHHLETCPACDTLAQSLDDHLDPFASALRHTVRPWSATPLPDLPPTLVGSMQTHPPAAPSGRTVAGYMILGELGRGGMGVVYKARQRVPDRLVALKMILAGSHAAAERRARFLAEADAIARLQHPNIIQVYEVGKDEETLFLALEYVGGGTLAQKLAGTPQPPKQAAALVETLGRASHHAHCQNVLHRDLKPANVLLTTDGVPKITDFGLAKHESSDLTATGVLVGTPSYMAPEQAAGAGQAIGPPADVYALGAILYEMLTGRPPFQGATALDTLDQVCHQEPVPPARLQPKVPRDLETICLKCLEKEPGRRYASAEALADDLQRFQQGRPVLARPLGRIGRTWRWCRRNPGWAAMLA